MTICNNKCAPYRARTKSYNNEYARCFTCAMFMDVDGIRCPCCKAPLRRHSRNKNTNRIKPRVK